MFRTKILSPFLAVVAVLAVSTAAHGTLIYWGGGTSTTWATGGNWTGGTAPSAANTGAFNADGYLFDPNITAALTVGGINVGALRTTDLTIGIATGTLLKIDNDDATNGSMGINMSAAGANLTLGTAGGTEQVRLNDASEGAQTFSNVAAGRTLAILATYVNPNNSSGTNILSFNGAGNVIFMEDVWMRDTGTGTRTMIWGGDGNVEIRSVLMNGPDLVNAHNMQYVGAGVLTLSGTSANTYTGTFTAGNGTAASTVVLKKTPGVNAVSGAMTVLPNATVRLGASNQIADAASVTVSGILDLKNYSETVNGVTFSGIAPELDISLVSLADFGKLTTTGTLALGAGVTTLKVALGGYTPADGDSFDILDWGTLTGSFAGLNLPDISGYGLAWNTDALTTNGTLSITPEPATLALLGLGAAGMLIRRRRK